MLSFFERFRKPKPEAETGPDVIVDFIFDQGLFFIAISNIGTEPANDISIAFNKTISALEGKKPINKLPLFNELLFLPPGKEIKTFLDSSISYFHREEPTDITVTVVFKDRSGKSLKNTIHHNLDIYKEIGYVSIPGCSAP